MDFPAKLSLTIQNSLPSFPKEIVNIVFQYTIVSGCEQYIEKYSKPQLFKGKCYKRVHGFGAAVDDSCKHEMIVNSRDECPKYCDKKRDMIISWYAQEYNVGYCSCKSLPSYITPLKFTSDDSSNYDKYNSFQACKFCSKIYFCSLAKSDSEICHMKKNCKSCGRFACKHGTINENHDTNSDDDYKVVDNCIFCKKLSPSETG